MHSSSSFIVLLILYHSGDTCIPTQTTCSTCTTIYDTTCDGSYGGCETEADAGVSYTYGTAPEAALAGLGSVCWNDLSCSVTNEYDATTGQTDGNGYGSTIAYCRESGAEAGNWFIWLNGAEVGLNRMRCKL